MQNCPDGEYEDTGTNHCLACDPGCATCFGNALTQCDTCSGASGTNYYKIVGATECAQTCPNGQFISGTLTLQCEVCSSECITCSGTATTCNIADGCATGFYFNNATSTCIANCLDGFYEDGSGFCEPCQEGCVLCDGPGLTACTQCGPHSTNPETYYKRIGYDICTLDCPTGEY